MYRGGWDHGVMHGKGFFEWMDGTRYEGDVVKGVLQGKGKFLFQDGSMYEVHECMPTMLNWHCRSQFLARALASG